MEIKIIKGFCLTMMLVCTLIAGAGTYGSVKNKVSNKVDSSSYQYSVYEYNPTIHYYEFVETVNFASGLHRKRLLQTGITESENNKIVIIGQGGVEPSGIVITSNGVFVNGYAIWDNLPFLP